jgi:hypothetical protein
MDALDTYTYAFPEHWALISLRHKRRDKPLSLLVIAGRLLSESNTSVELIDSAGQKHALSRHALRGLTASDISDMPEGFVQLPEQDLVDLPKFLASSNVKH